MTNRSGNIQNSFIVKTGLPHFLTMTVTLMRSHLPKLGPQITKYRDYKNFSNAQIRSYMIKGCNKFQSTLELDSLPSIRKTPLNKTSPLKQKYARTNKTILKISYIKTYKRYCEYYEWYYEVLRDTTRYYE